MHKPKVILFAGAAGSGKTPIATYLSWNLSLPIFNNDAIRREVLEDTRVPLLDDELHLARRNERLNTLIKSQRNFILDASVDRTWPELEKALSANNYEYFIISLNLSKNLLSETANAKAYTGTTPKEIVERWFTEHELFVKNNDSIIGLSITDVDYPNRLELSRVAVSDFIKS